MELCSWLPHYLIRRFLQNIIHLHLERQQKAVGPNLMMTCNGESVSVYHVITSPASIITTLTSPHLTSPHVFILGFWASCVWSIYTVNSSVLHKKQFSWSAPTLPSLFFPEKCFTLLIFLSVWWTRRMFSLLRGWVWPDCVKYVHS